MRKYGEWVKISQPSHKNNMRPNFVNMEYSECFPLIPSSKLWSFLLQRYRSKYRRDGG